MAHWPLASRSLSRRSQQLLWVSGPRGIVRDFSAAQDPDAQKATLPACRGIAASRVLSNSPSTFQTRSALPSNGQYHNPQQIRRTYASTPATSAARIISTTKEHSPGHNVATLAVSNPAKLNIVNSAVLDDFIRECQKLSKDDSLRAVVLTNAPINPGKASSWIGGADIKEMIELSSSDQARAFIDRIHATCEALRKIPVPVIASIDGFCLGGGMEIAATCDLRVATHKSVFGMPEVKVGIPSVVEAAYLPGLIGMGRTRRLLYLAENIDAVEAERWGFVEKVVADEMELEQATSEWVDALVGMGPKAIRSQKVLMQKWENCSVEDGIEAGAVAYAEAYADGGTEPKEFMGRFVGRKR